MKTFYTLLTTLIFLISNGQTQIGNDINGVNAFDEFGDDLSFSTDGQVLAIGATGNDENGSNSGEVRVYRNESGSWIQIGQDINGELVNNFLGSSLSLSSDGSILAIGISGANSFTGKVKVYKIQSDNWVQIGQDINGQSGNGLFGGSISLSSDGTLLAIAAIGENTNGSGSGKVRVYENQSDNWVQIGQDLNGENAFDLFGQAIKLNGNGNILAIGAPGVDGNASNTGSVRIYENQSSNWVQIGQDINGDASDSIDSFGGTLSLSSEGSIIAIGGVDLAGPGVYNTSAVRIYENQLGSWVQIGQDIDSETSNDGFGRSISLSSDGSILAIGIPTSSDSSNNAGIVRLFENKSGNWIQLGQDIDGENNFEYFGETLSLSSDASIIAIGSPFNDNSNQSFGNVRVFDLTNVLSVEELGLNNFSIYPNPAKAQFTIQLSDSVQLNNITIYNNLGQKVLETDKFTVNTSQLASGLYIVEIETNKGKGSKKLIIE